MLQPRITAVEVIEPYKLRLSYETGEIKDFDVEPYVSGPWFGELRDSTYFQTVRITPDGNGIEWEHGQDIAPHELYDYGIPVAKRPYPGEESLTDIERLHQKMMAEDSSYKEEYEKTLPIYQQQRQRLMTRKDRKDR